MANLTTANKAVLNKDLRKEVQQKSFFTRWTGLATPRKTDAKYIPSGSPIDLFNFKYEGRDSMQVPVLIDMEGYGEQGKGTLAGNEEEVEFYYQSIFIGLKRSGLRLPDIVDQEIVNMYAKYKDYETLLSNWWAYYESHDVARAFYEGFSKHVTDAAADNGMAKGKRFNPNFWHYDATEKDFSDSPTFSYTAATYEAAISTAMGVTDETTNGFDHYVLEAIAGNIPYHNIEGIDVGGDECHILIIHPLQAIDLRQDTVWSDAQGRAGGVKLDNPLFKGNIGWWGNICVIVNGLAARIPYYDGTSVNFFDYDNGATTVADAKSRYRKVQMPPTTVGTVHNVACAILLGKTCMAKGLYSPLSYKQRNVEDYGMVTGIGADQFYGYARNDIYNEFLGDSTAPSAKKDTQSAIIVTFVSR